MTGKHNYVMMKLNIPKRVTFPNRRIFVCDINVFLEINCLQRLQSDEDVIKDMHLKTREEEGGIDIEVVGYLILSKKFKKFQRSRL